MKIIRNNNCSETFEVIGSQDEVNFTDEYQKGFSRYCL